MFLKITKLTAFIGLSFSIFIGSETFAAHPVNQPVTIYETSIQWDNEADKTTLLETTPKWSFKTINTLFDVYLHPERHQLKPMKNVHSYNIQFINAFWGPLDNPFNQYRRPAKLFVFLGEANTPYFMLPLVRDEADGNFYVFDNNQKQPILLNDWIIHIKNKHGHTIPIKFNLCNGYGNLPADACLSKSYQNETKDIYKNSARLTTNAPSAYRAREEDWQKKVAALTNTLSISQGSIYGDSISWKEIEARNALLNTTSTWSNYAIIKRNFESIRDKRYFDDESQPDFLRRITWLYPDDGCWTRASAVIKDLFGPYVNPVNAYSRPSKIFAFGNLCVNTTNSPHHSVSWWYHTAPIIRDNETHQSYVLDPSVNPERPLKVEEWMTEITSRSGACSNNPASNRLTFNICDGYGTNPYDSCKDSQRIGFQDEVNAVLYQSLFRKYERSRQIALGRDPSEVLGDSPPWV